MTFLRPPEDSEIKDISSFEEFNEGLLPFLNQVVYPSKNMFDNFDEVIRAIVRDEIKKMKENEND
jgi:hypothetical protein